ncbi:unnamed protein product, partial [Hapterophycus canaliculatus]
TAKQQGLQLFGDLEGCEACLGVRMPRASVTPTTTTRSPKPLETVHMDVAGPYQSSVGTSRYLV